MAGRLAPLRLWASSALKAGISIVLIHDIGDRETELELCEFVEGIKSEQLTFVSGVFNGPGAARNEGLRLVKTQFFCFWDSDDLPDVTYFAEMVKFAVLNDFELVVGEYKSKSGREISEHKLRDNSSKNALIIALNPGIWRMIFSTKSFQRYQFQNLKLAEDQLFLAEIGFPEVRYGVFLKSVYQYEVGVNGSLTSHTGYFSDLVSSLQAIDHLIYIAKTRKRRKFLTILVLRQSLTLLKNGKLKLFTVGFYIIIKSFIRILTSNFSRREMISNEER
jgi:glycosyltransferase involved in cell wall biosynthesis